MKARGWDMVRGCLRIHNECMGNVTGLHREIERLALGREKIAQGYAKCSLGLSGVRSVCLIII